MFKLNKIKYQKIKQALAFLALFILAFNIAWAVSLAQGQEVSTPKREEEIILISLHVPDPESLTEDIFATINEVSVIQVNPIEVGLPSQPADPKVVGQGKVIVTAYSSTPDQTDSSPFITANGTYVHDGVLASNFLSFGTKVRFPEYFGDKIFTVQDRMAKKNSHKMDVWMETRYQALQFGVKYLAYEIVK